MPTSWVLLLTDDAELGRVAARLADRAGVPLRGAIVPGAGPPELVLIGAERLAEPLPPLAGAAVPRILLVRGEPPGPLWRAALELAAEQVVLLPAGEAALLTRLTRLAGRHTARALVIATAGGCGGAGASVLAAGLARAAAPLGRCLLVDLDRLGSGADLLLGAEDEPGLRWPELAAVRGRLLPDSLAGLPVIDGIHVLSWDRSPLAGELPAAAVEAVLATARDEFGVVVLDLPRGLDPAAGAATRAADLVLLVVPAEVRAAAGAQRAAGILRDLCADVRLVVRPPAPTGLRPERIADALDLPLAGVLRPEPGVRPALDRGEPPGLRRRGPLATLCRELLAHELSAMRFAGGRA
jgi:secretion/DNA translocation related CpaE-like protein